MKNIIISFLLSYLLAQCYSTKGQTNVYHPFPDSNAVWGMYGSCFDTNCGDDSYIKFYYEGDTIIEGTEYKKVAKEVLPMTSGNCCYVPTGLGTGFLRQDIAAKKVYWRDQLMETDTLLYDFSLNVGDTLNSFLNYPEPWYEPKKVLSIDSVWVGTSYRKRFNIDTSDFRNEYTYSIIEGVGGTHGFRGLVDPNVWASGTLLTCFSVNGNVIYTPQTGADTIPCGALPVSVQEFYQPKGDLVSIYPNPSSSDHLRLRVGFPYDNQHMELHCYDNFGRLIHSRKIYNGQQDTVLDVSTWPPGIYIAVVYSDGSARGKAKFVVR